MKTQIGLFFFVVGLILISSQAAAQLPKEAICAVCSVHEGTTAPEKVVAMTEYRGEKYYFCSEKCKETFDGDPEGYVPPVLPRPAPNFSLKTVKGEHVALENLRGKVVLLDFWATWCKPCAKSMPELQKLHEQHAGQGLAVLGISIDEQAEKKVPAFLAKRGLAYPIAIDAAENPAWEAYKVKVIPAMFLIDRDGQIVQQWVGETKFEEVSQAVLAKLEQKGKPLKP